MEQTYFAPNTKIVNIELQNILAGTTPADQLNEKGSIDLGGSEEGGGEGVELGSRRNSFWDD